MGSSIASRWEELSGSNNWEGLLQPLDPDLRRYIIHYGQMVGAIQDLFSNCDPKKPGFEKDFFSEACLVKGNPYKYDIKRFVYACSSWYGYVAVATDEGKQALGRRDILVAWRGCRKNNFMEWVRNAHCSTISASNLLPINVKKPHGAVHRGFYSTYTRKTHCDPSKTSAQQEGSTSAQQEGSRSRSKTSVQQEVSRSRTKTSAQQEGSTSAQQEGSSKTSAREQVQEAVRELVKEYKNEEISITVIGYSLGGALATLTALDIVANKCNKPEDISIKPCMVTAFTYGSPRIGNAKLGSVFDSFHQHLHLLRIVNEYDAIPTLPTKLFYTHFGKKLTVDTSVSSYLKTKKPSGKRTSAVVVPLDEEKGERQPKRKRSTGPCDEPNPKRSRRCTLYKGIINLIETSCRESHNIDMYAHGVAIQDIEKNIPVDKLDHDIALVNKHSNRVKKEHGIPKEWWASENRKKMEQEADNGRWKLVES